MGRMYHTFLYTEHCAYQEGTVFLQQQTLGDPCAKGPAEQKKKKKKKVGFQFWGQKRAKNEYS